MKTILLKIIKRIIKEKKGLNIVPTHVTLLEIRIEILSMTESELSDMVKGGDLSTGPTGNSEYYDMPKMQQ